ncbi:hypothetical protein [Rhizobium sp. S163]|uniref:glycosyltransferase family protein n=1 Tax=Rhizobium sp. S163 TaxID=3055039 RepID=UPI0025A9AE32|nr:hypothetical protein [Rhizobium sp. S163]MDM9646676.1 hypothetical protein [Rhizobium sp. S163]
MPPNSLLPANVLKRFAVVKLWPELKTAEDECIARLKIAAKAIGAECVEIHADGRLIMDPSIIVSKATVDFVIHLHYDTPKLYDAFSFVALWNPMRFYHEWGYHRCSRNLVTHDDFISCSSDTADDHVKRMIRHEGTHRSPRFYLYHSTPDIVHPPSLGDGKLVYAGINWDALKGGHSRHQELLQHLDKTGLLRIYGPTIFHGVKVWDGYASYVKEVPFDGVSMIDEISKAGVSLVLSSQAHKESGLMSNRLFESIAAGALVICDENQFAKKFFGDSLLYIDTRATVAQTFEAIVGHMDWAAKNPGLALKKIQSAQDLFREKFTLIRNLTDLYTGLPERKQELTGTFCKPIKIRLDCLMPQFSEEVLAAHIKSVCAQEYTHFHATLWTDAATVKTYGSKIQDALKASPVPIELRQAEFTRVGIYPEIQSTLPLGSAILEIVDAAKASDALVIVAPNERLFSNHLDILAAALQRDVDASCAATAVIVKNGGDPIHSVDEIIDFGHTDRVRPTGYGRFIFRSSALPADIDMALPYLHGRPLAVLRGNSKVTQLLPATIVLDAERPFPDGQCDDAAETEVIRSFSAKAMNVLVGTIPVSSSGQVLRPARPRLRKLLVSRNWWVAQVYAIRKSGLRARLKVLKQRLS